MREIRPSRYLRLATAVLLALLVVPSAGVRGASHRKAPLIALDPAADNTDVYAFRSWVDPSKVVFILNVIPGQHPGDGPNYLTSTTTSSIASTSTTTWTASPRTSCTRFGSRPRPGPRSGR